MKATRGVMPLIIGLVMSAGAGLAHAQLEYLTLVSDF